MSEQSRRSARGARDGRGASFGVRRFLAGAAALAAAVVAAVGVAVKTDSIAFGQPAARSLLTGDPNGPHRADPTWHALVGATVHLAPGEHLDGVTVVIRDGWITDLLVGRGGVGDPPQPPRGARVWDYSGRHIYPGFIDAFVEVSSPRPDGDAPGAHWNELVMPQRSALDGSGVDSRTAGSLRELGFTAAGVVPRGGIFRGTGAVVSLRREFEEHGTDRPPVYRERTFHAMGFDRGRRQEVGGYPTSQMGVMALMRQVLWDSEHRRAQRAEGVAEESSCLDALLDDFGGSRDDRMALAFDVGEELQVLRAAKIAEEFGRPVVGFGSGLEFRRLSAIAGVDWRGLVVPVDYPRTPRVTSIGEAEAVDLRELMTWEQAPTNLRRLEEAGVNVAVTSARLRNRNEFRENLRLAVEAGLPEDAAIAMLTTRPAELLGVSDRLGTIETGKAASLVVTDGPYLAKETKVWDVWIDGERHEITPAPDADLEGEWAVTLSPDPGDGVERTLSFDSRNRVRVHRGEKSVRARHVQVVGERFSFTFDHGALGEREGVYTVAGVIEGGAMRGHGVSADGAHFAWRGVRVEEEAEEPGEPGEPEAPDEPEEAKEEEEEEERADEPEVSPRLVGVPEEYGYPFGAYAVDELPSQEDVLFTNATVWTCGPEGVIERGWVLVTGGKIERVGRGGPPGRFGGVRVIDCEGRHITPGIVDCHSHTGLFRGGVNETGSAVTAEVRIADITDPDTVSWYRQLAGGVTAVNSLHGSANPIGGQSQTQKVRWGVRHPDEMHFEGATPGIKFALGENVKQSNRGDRFTTRYPQTRMGVETIIRDRFIAARRYMRERYEPRWEHAVPVGFEDGVYRPVFEEGTKRVIGREVNRRRDLELEALAEVLMGRRLVHCHSYRQDEILMMCRVAQEFGFRIGTFQHVLEGYKVAPEIAEAAIGASAFSDWWGFKVEVQDGIPYGGAVMHEQGVNVSFNSDSDELARRLNLEAAKAVRYGGVAEGEALKFVTINPAIQLGIGDRVGSIETGKDADLVVWSGHPLSVHSVAESTWIDGREYFSLERDRELRERNASERRRIIQKILSEGAPRRDRPGREESEGDEAEPEGDPGWARGWEDDLRSGAAAGRGSLLDRMRGDSREVVREYYLEMLRRGIDPEMARCGECGGCVLDTVWGRVEVWR